MKRQLCLLTLAILFVLGGCASNEQGLKTESADLVKDTAPYNPKDVEKDFMYESQPLRGSATAPINIVEFGDYKCPWCKKWSEEVLNPVLAKYMDDGQVNFRYINMSFVGPDSQVAAEIGEAIKSQSDELFWQYHDLVLANQGDHNEEWATEAFLYGLIESKIPDADVSKIKEEVESGRAKEEVEKDISIAKTHGVEHSPTIYVNGKLFDSRYSSDELSEYFDKILSAK